MKKFFLFSFLFLNILSHHLIAQKSDNSTDVHFLTKDNIQISASYQFPENKSGLIPAIILIHQGGSWREEWKNLALWDMLLNEGYAILAYDIRSHGKSDKDDGNLNDLFNNSKRSPLDLMAAIDFLEKDTRIDKFRIGIIGASIGANLACVAAASPVYHIQSAVSISAKTSAVQNLSGTKDPVKPKQVFYIASKNEQNGLREEWAQDLFSKTTGKKKIKIHKGNKHGSFILKESIPLQKEIVAWFKNTL